VIRAGPGLQPVAEQSTAVRRCLALPNCGGVGGDPTVRPKELSDREVVRLLKQCRKANTEPVTAVAFGEWLLNQRLDQYTKDGRPPVVQIRQHVLMALYWLRFAHEPCKVEAGARDIWDSFEIKILSPRKHCGQKSRNIKSASALAAELRSGRKNCGAKAVLWIMLSLIECSEEFGEFGGASFECKPAAGGLGELVSIMPRPPAVLSRWIDAWLAEFSTDDKEGKPTRRDEILKLAQHARERLAQEFVAASRKSA
jgi:hypothetical protein